MESKSKGRRSNSEYQEALQLMEDVLQGYPDILSNKRRAKFNDLQKLLSDFNNNIKTNNLEITPVNSPRTIGNYINALLQHTSNNSNSTYFYRADNAAWNVEPKQDLKTKIKLHFLSQILRPHRALLPDDWNARFATTSQVDSFFRVAEPFPKENKELDQLMVDLTELIIKNKIAYFHYQKGILPGGPSDDRHISDGGHLFEAMVFPLQISYYMDRLYLLAIKLTEDDLANKEPHEVVHHSKLRHYNLADIHKLEANAFDEHIVKCLPYQYLKEKLVVFEKGLSARDIMKNLNLHHILQHLIGVFLPSVEQLKTQVDESDEPLPFRWCFCGWAFRYIQSSPLHSSQKCINKKLLQSTPDRFCVTESDRLRPMEVGLFEFKLFRTVDWEFRIKAFREFQGDDQLWAQL